MRPSFGSCTMSLTSPPTWSSPVLLPSSRLRWAPRPRRFPSPRPNPAPDGRPSALLLAYARQIATHRSVTLHEVLRLPEGAIVAEFAAMRRDLIIERAQAVHGMGDQERGKRVAALRRSADDDDRYVAEIVMRWAKAK